MNSATDLFPSATSISPHAAWLLENDLITREYQHPHSLNGGARWICANRAMTRCCSAETEDAAEQAYCERHGVAWWKLATWNEAMITPQAVAEMFSADAERMKMAMAEEMEVG